MSRTDKYLDSMLRHLGAAYYESRHGRATRADVTRALDTVEEHLSEQEEPPEPADSPEASRPGEERTPASRRVRWVRDVMTISTVTVDRATPYKEIACLLTEHRISGVPVLMMGRHVVGVVTEDDLLAARERTARRVRAETASGKWWHARRQRHPALTAEELMTSPAFTISPEATVAAAARMMIAHGVTMLPVVGEDGAITGIVSRHDLLTVFRRSDTEIAGDVRDVLGDILLAAPASVTATVRNGVVTLTGGLPPVWGEHADLVPAAIRLIWGIDGVVDIVNRLGEASQGAAPGDRTSVARSS